MMKRYGMRGREKDNKKVRGSGKTEGDILMKSVLSHIAPDH